MKLQFQPNQWTCLATAFAMAMNIKVEEMFQLLGHDGSKKIWDIPDDRYNKSGHHIQEIIDAGFNLSYMIVCVDTNPRFTHFEPTNLRPYVWPEEKAFTRIHQYLKHNSGVIVGTVGFNKGHAVAWNNEDKCIYDPFGKIIPYKDFEMGMQEFYLCKRMF